MGSIVEAAIKSTEHYLHHLKEKGGGVELEHAKRDENTPPEQRFLNNMSYLGYTFTTKTGLALQPDQELIYLPRDSGERVECILFDYDKKEGIVVLGFAGALHSTEGFIEIDFKWLIKRALRWYELNGSKIKTPPWRTAPAKQSPGNLTRTGLPNLSDAQVSAILACLTKSFTYTWGPPGTGKTKHALAGTALSLVREGRRIIVTAPTNNAVDNAIQAILDVHTKIIKRADVIRLGTPTTRFLEENPDICEDKHVLNHLKVLQKDIDRYSALVYTLGKIQNLRDQSRTKKAQVATFQAKADQLLGQVDSCASQHELISAGISKAEDDLAILTEDLARLNIAAKELKWYDKVFITSRKRHLDSSISKMTSAVEARQMLLRASRSDLSKLLAKSLSLQSQHAECIDSVSKIEDELRRLEIVNRNLEAEALEFQDANIQESIEQIKTEIQRLAERKLKLEIDLSGKKIIGLTLDGFIGRSMQTSFAIDQVLVDEAAYAPLAKFLPLLSLNVSISLFGDHRQLPPVCEADSQDALSQSYWGKSALFLDHAWQHALDYNLLFSAQEPRFSKLTVTKLPHSHRYGAELASVLHKHVYHDLELTGDARNATQIIFVDVMQNPDPVIKRVNHAEVSEATQIVRMLVKEGVADIAIITPYKNQAKAVYAGLRRGRIHHHAEVLNTHKAQGREWDTVIFSTVDAAHPPGPYFTDSQNLNGLLVLNTTLSRVKKQIWILADGRYWIGKKQLISDLISIAEHRETF